MNVFITGGTGFLGSGIIKVLSESDYINKIFVLCRDKKKVPILIDFIQNSDKVVFVYGDLGIDGFDRHYLSTEVFMKNVIDCVIHCGAIRNIGYCNSRPEEVMDVNVGGTIRLLDLAKEHSVKKFIYISSQGVYDSTKLSGRIDEEMPVFPNSAYSKSKLASELILSLYKSDISYCILRISRLIGFSPFMNGDNFLTSAYPKACFSDGKLNVYDEGRQKLNVISIHDVAGAILALIKESTEEHWNKTYNICDDRRYSVFEIAEYYIQWCNQNNRNVHLENVVTMSAADFPDLDNSLIKKSLGWKPTVLKNSIFQMMDELENIQNALS